MVAGLYALACALQILLFLPLPFMAMVSTGLSGALLLAAQIRLFYDTMYGRNAALYQSLPVSTKQLTISKILAAALGIWLVAAAMGIASALARVLMRDSMSMVAFLQGDDARLGGAEAVLRLLVPRLEGGDAIEGADGLAYATSTAYSPGQYALWVLDLLLLGAAVSAAIFLVVILYQTIRRSTGALLIGIFVGLFAAVMAGICAYIAMTGWLLGGTALSFTVRTAIGCAVNLATLLLWGAACQALLRRWYAR